jgi:signal transduction histidine kinase
LGAAKLRAQLIEHQIPKKVKPIFTDLQAMLSDSMLQSRFIMTEMSPPVLNELGLISALEWLTEQIGSRYGMNISFKSKEHDKTLLLPRDVEVLFFQVTRELLMNVVKHSNAQSATVKFSSDDQKVKLEVSDNGISFDIRKTFQPDIESGFGLYCIREWLRHIGGVMTIKSRSGEGTKVLISAPREFEK